MRNAESFQVLRKVWVAHVGLKKPKTLNPKTLNPRTPEVLKTLAEAKLNWKGDPRSAEGWKPKGRGLVHTSWDPPRAL